MSTVRVIYVPADGRPRVVAMPNSLVSYSRLVGGPIERVSFDANCDVVARKDADKKGCRENKWIPGIHGNAVMIGKKRVSSSADWMPDRLATSCICCWKTNKARCK